MLIQKLNSFRIILGSNSPRRQLLLRKLGLNFEVIARNIGEDYPPHLQKEKIAVFLCERKSQAFDDIFTDDKTILITADTIVWIDGKNIGKPKDAEEARQTLKTLSGKKHDVITGVCLRSARKSHIFHECTEVFFNSLHDDEIEYYVSHFKPFDKAGAYAIQEWIGYASIGKIIGSYQNVMGLPIQRVYKELLKFCEII
ncbi:MAG: septum formation protein Maf [Bacteroidales bacterium]|jgi:septum formation protein|nr:septum formation protein Maf [Bacteroidales bacterium]